MEFSEIYRGVTISVRYDPVTLTFIGGLTGLGHPVSIQAATYEDLQDACTKAVDDALIADTKSVTDYADELHRAEETTEQRLEAVMAVRTGLRREEPASQPEDDPFSNRRFLR